jgi:START domain-containing protein
MTRECLSLCLGLTFLSVALPVRAQDWKLIGTEQGVEFYRRELPGSHITAFKGKGTVEAPLWKVASILLDTGRANEWVSSLKESRVVRRLGPARYIEYNRVGGPFIMKDRDFVSDVRIEVDAQAKTFALVYQPTGDAAAPPTRYVRGEILAGLFHARSLETAGTTELTAEVQCDPKGIIPAWVVNFFQKSWPIQTFQGIRAQAAKEDITTPVDFADVIAPTRQF